MSYTFLTELWGTKVLNGERTIDQVPNYLRSSVEEYVASHQSESK